MGRSGCFVVLILIVAVLVMGYDQLRIEQMRSEVSAISNKFHLTGVNKAAGGKTDVVTTLAQAEQHTRLAKGLIRKNKTKQAQAELDKALADLKSANTVSSDIVGDVASFFGQARNRAVASIEKARKDISEETQPKKQ